MSNADANRWINLEKVSVLALEQSVYGQKILCQMLRGFGIRQIHGARNVAEAMALTKDNVFDLAIADPGFDEGKGLEFIRWLRRADGNANRFAPLMLMLGHSTPSSVSLSRNTGVNYVVAKPCTPKALLERILWVARDKRPYVEVGDYVGPDRRLRAQDLPGGVSGRRAGDQTARAAGQGAAPDDDNLSSQKQGFA
jgi:DNA-binding response OmpR family regulator